MFLKKYPYLGKHHFFVLQIYIQATAKKWFKMFDPCNKISLILCNKGPEIDFRLKSQSLKMHRCIDIIQEHEELLRSKVFQIFYTILSCKKVTRISIFPLLHLQEKC